MAEWGEILKEINTAVVPVDAIRRKYLAELSAYTKRNTIAYYSAFLTKTTGNLSINDNDMNGFMATIKGLDPELGLDLILHTPGGAITAAESIVNYIKSKFGNNFRVIVPQIAMSAGTMIACSSKEIIMGKQSSLGPIDPQIMGVPAYNVTWEFDEAQKDLEKNPNNVPFWSIRLRQFPAAFLKNAWDAIQLSTELATTWLSSNMFEKSPDKVESIVSQLNNHEDTKVHDRHFNIEKCKEIGLNIYPMENDNVLQDKILSVHHAFMISFDSTACVKIVENNNGKTVLSISNPGASK